MFKMNESIEKAKNAGLITEFEALHLQLKEILRFKKVYDYIEKEAGKKEDGVKYKGNSKVVKAAFIIDMIEEELVEFTKEEEEEINKNISYYLWNYGLENKGMSCFWDMEVLKKYAGLYEGYRNVVENAEAAGGIRRMVEGGCFRIYYSDIKDFINDTGLNPNKKEYDDDKSWELYKYLCCTSWNWLLYLIEKKK